MLFAKSGDGVKVVEQKYRFRLQCCVGRSLTPLSLSCHLSGEACSGRWVLGPGTMQNLLVTALILLSAGVTSSGAAVLPSQKQVLDTLHQVLNVYLFVNQGFNENLWTPFIR